MDAARYGTPAALAAVAALLVPAAALAQDTGGSSADGGAPATTTAPTGSTGPSGTSGATGDSTPLTLPKTRIKSLQRRLKVKADGAVGAKTRSAIRKVERREDLPVDGKPDAAVLKAVGLTPPAATPATGSTTAPASAPAGGGDVQAAVAAARSQIGTPYASGGNGPGGFDCSGLTVYAFKAAGITLPRTSFDQYGEGTAIEKAQIQSGDLVFFDTAGSGASHVGIATSPTTVISATTQGVREHQIDDDYWGAHYVGARRIGATQSASR